MSSIPDNNDFDLKSLALLTKKIPLQKSWEVNEYETELKELLLDIAHKIYIKKLFDANVIGAPYLGSLDLVRDSVVNDGLTVVRSIGDEVTNHYLLKSWLGKNSQGRGLEFLETYLQLQFPNSATVTQLWHDKHIEYPNALRHTKEKEDDFLTSRIFIEIDLAKVIQYSGVSGVPVGGLSDLRNNVTNVLPARIIPTIYYGISIGSCQELANVAETITIIGENISAKDNLVNCGVVNITPYLCDEEITMIFPETTSYIEGRLHVGKMVTYSAISTSIYPKA